MRRRNRRSPEAKAWRKLYGTKAWANARAQQLSEQPLCERCMSVGKVVAATVVNHRIPHKGDLTLFHDHDNYQSLCKTCHDGEVQSMERTGRTFDRAVGTDGIPVDPGHPWHIGGEYGT